MPWRSNSLWIRAAGIAALWIVSAGIASHAQQPIFLQRGINPAATVQDVPQTVSGEYAQIYSERSLLVPFCLFKNAPEQICPDSSFYSLEQVFASAASLAGVDSTSAKRQLFTQGTAGDKPPFAYSKLTLDTMFPSFNLIAVVNRMDLATWSEGTNTWKNAELRFVYGITPKGDDKGHFTIIVEFVLPEKDWVSFRQQAMQWKGLGPQSVVPASSVPKKLSEVIESSGYRKSSLVRIRVNCQAIGGQWRFSEWVFQNHAPKFSQHELDYQISSDYTDPTLDESPLTQKREEEYATFWKTALREAKGATPVQPSRNLSTQTQDYRVDTTRGFFTPPATLPDSKELRDTRNVLALQQCTQCHSRETGTILQHISEAGKISNFLVPYGKWNPTLEELTSGGDAVLSVPINYCVSQGTDETIPGKPGPACKPTQIVATDVRRYHDLARRKLFLATLLAAPANGPNPGDVAAIMQNGPDFVH